jgi:hypothetical protein
MTISVALLRDYTKIFSGNNSGYGVHIYGEIKKGLKEKDGKSYTKNEILTEAKYKDHLEGKQGLGISPIDDKSNCLFGIIDIDFYNNSYDYIIEMIYKKNLPLFPFRSKSGGLHIYLFLKELVKAKKLVDLLKEFCVILGLPKDTEIFPKQTSLSEGIGNWVNLPYYNHEKTSSYLIKPNGEAYILREALSIIEDNRKTFKHAEDIAKTLDLNDAPPCLQHIYLKGETQFRNEYLFSLARYYKTKYGDDFGFHLTTANNNLKNPNDLKEIKATISSHNKRDYSYKCQYDPLASYCNKQICKNRQFGIGGDEVSELSYEDFIQYQTDPPHYEWIINGQSLKFYDEFDIMRQDIFRKLCFRQLHILPIKLKEINWTKIVNNSLKNVVIKAIDEGDDISPGTMFKEYLTEFLESRAMAETREHIIFDRVYKDEDIQCYVFKSKNLIGFLTKQKQFRYYGQVEIHDKLRQLGGEPKRYYISQKLKNSRVWTLPFGAIKMFIQEVDIDQFKINFLENYDNQEAF